MEENFLSAKTSFLPDTGDTIEDKDKDRLELDKDEEPLDDFPIEQLELEKEDEDNTERGNWSHKMDFLLSLLGFAVGLSNIWRFPYLCYRNGGGAFLIPYWIFMFTCGVPLFFLETAMGQFTSKSVIASWSICPIFKGAGIASVIISVVYAIYYNVMMSYVVFYFLQSFTLGELPWASCDNPWNTPDCLNYNNQTLVDMYREYRLYATNTSNTSHPGFEYVKAFNRTLRSPSDEYFHNRVLQISEGLDSPGGIVWELFFCLIPVWIVTGFCLIKGVRSVGKVVYFTATFPYLILTILLIRGLTLPGAMDGIKFYIIPDFSKLGKFQVWCDAAFQVFFSLGPGWGGLVTMGSYNKFNNNCYIDGLIVPVIMGLSSLFAGFVVFSTIGFMAHSVGTPVTEVVTHGTKIVEIQRVQAKVPVSCTEFIAISRGSCLGPGLAFIMYPEVVTKLPFWSQFWSAVFFLMLFTVGLDSQFVMLETSIITVWEELPTRYKLRRECILFVTCVVCFVLGLPCVTNGGMYLFQIIDTYSITYTIIAVCICEAAAVFWVYGAERFLDDVKFMIGYRPHLIIWSVIWRFCTFGIVLSILIIAVVQYSPLKKYGDYEYPPWSKLIGWGFCFISLLWIPGWAIGRFILDSGSTFTQKLKGSLVANKSWGPASKKLREQWNDYRRVQPYGKDLVHRLRHINRYGSIAELDDGRSSDDC